MPVKLPNKFRRKSSGNALDKQDPPPSFRVIPRDEVQAATETAAKTKRMSLGRPLSSPSQPPQQASSEEDSGTSFRGSEGSSAANSAISRVYDTSSSARFSSSSTLPSSTTDAENEEFPKRRSIPTPTSDWRSFSFLGAARTFKPGAKGHKVSTSVASEVDKGEISQEFSTGSLALRDRAMTTSSYASTAMAPKIDGDLGLGSTDFGSGFGDLLEGAGRRGSAIMEETETSHFLTPTAIRSDSAPMLSLPAAAYAGHYAPRSSGAILPLPPTNKSDNSACSWDSRDNHDRGMCAYGPQESAFQAKPPSVPIHAQALASEAASANSGVVFSAAARVGGYPIPSQNLAKTPNYNPRVPEDADAKAVRDSVIKRKSMHSEGRIDASSKIARENSGLQPNTLSAASSSSNSMKTPSLSSAGSSVRTNEAPLSLPTGRRVTPTPLFDSDQVHSNDTTPRATKAEPHGEDEPLFSHSTIADANAAFKFSETKDETPRRMTDAQFQRERKQKELSRSNDNGSESDSEESDYYDDVDETERNREQAKQRRKQEADLAVFRQQMKKTTGEKTTELSSTQFRPSSDGRFHSANNLLAGIGATPDRSGPSSDDEDDEIPLGILKEHGFPNKNRPPTKLHASNSYSNLRVVSQTGQSPARPGSIAGSVAGAPRGNLPVFARNLPVDLPYFGAGIVNAPNREPLAFNRSAGSVYGGGVNNSMPQLPPLVAWSGSSPPRSANGPCGAEVPTSKAIMMPLYSHQMPYMQPQFNAMPQQMHPQMAFQGTMMGAGQSMGMGAGMGAGIGMMPPVQDENARMQAMQLQLEMMRMQNFQPMPSATAFNPSYNNISMAIHPPNQFNDKYRARGRQDNYSLESLGPSPLPAPIRSKEGEGWGCQTKHHPQQYGMSMLQPPSQWCGMAPNGYAPSMQGLNTGAGNGYAPSIAPSERSNIGMSPRYRPVHLGHDAASTVASSATVLPTYDMNDKLKVTEKNPYSRGVAANAAPEEDEEGWGDFKKKRGPKDPRSGGNTFPRN
ncbi:hypothetical protein H2199_003092 [Coniosporium tulheliwenetii]|uniref:Uncharacterized protein n=1 Tax=Coniosporium tulheliwenetii TaxID=3383036 RepID=A0ACC2ZBH8_9PEZI|nr:hypothetical protein H2199_003092 [Cladosporium sp. JES 115]